LSGALRILPTLLAIQALLAGQALAQVMPMLDIPWKRLGNPPLDAAKKQRLKQLLNDTWNYGGCGGPIAYCLKEMPDEPWTIRTGKAVIRMFQNGMSDGQVAIEMMLREQSCNAKTVYDFNLEDHPPKGTPGAPVTLVIWSDFQCPACRGAMPLVDRLLEEYPNKIVVYYKHFPIPKLHPKSISAALAAIAAHRFGKFWPMHDLLYKNAPDNLSGEEMVGYGVSLGIDEKEFRKAFAAPTTYQYLDRDVREGNKSRVDRTPLFYFNGKRFMARRDFETLVERVAEELDLLAEKKNNK